VLYAQAVLYAPCSTVPAMPAKPGGRSWRRRPCRPWQPWVAGPGSLSPASCRSGFPASVPRQASRDTTLW